MGWRRGRIRWIDRNSRAERYLFYLMMIVDQKMVYKESFGAGWEHARRSMVESSCRYTYALPHFILLLYLPFPTAFMFFN